MKPAFIPTPEVPPPVPSFLLLWYYHRRSVKIPAPVLNVFLNPFRSFAPDIDLDVADIHRDDLIHYLADTYGKGKSWTNLYFWYHESQSRRSDIGRVMVCLTPSGHD